MSIIQYWSILEAFLIFAVLAGIFFWLWRTIKTRAPKHAPHPTTWTGRIGAGILHVLRLVGFFTGAFLTLALVVMIERTIYSLITETAPAPSQVTKPPDLEFTIEEVAFESSDGLKLAGWYIPAQNNTTIILLHGFGGNRTGTLWHARQLVPAGYGVLMYDERGSGESEGTYRSYGWEDSRDVEGAIRFIEERTVEGQPRIGIAGCSIGGQIALQGAAHFPEIGAVWADGASSLRARDLPTPTNPFSALIKAGNYTLEWSYEIKLGIEAPQPMIEIIGNIAPRPIMLVGSGRSMAFIGNEGVLLSRYQEYAGDNAELWIIDEAYHCGGPKVRPDEYAARMTAFFDAAFGITR